MAKPTYAQVHIDQPLTNISIAYRPSKFIAEQVFPRVPVTKISDKFFVNPRAEGRRREAEPRAMGTRASRGDYGLTTDSYVCTEKAIAKGVPDEIVDNADNPLRPAQDATNYVTAQILLELESEVAGNAFGAGWSSSATPSPTWDNATSTPIEDVETAHNNVVSNIGNMPNVGVMGRGLWRYLKQHPDIVDRIKYSAGPNSPAVVTLQAVAALFEVDRIPNRITILDTPAEGAASSLSYIWGNHLLVAYVTA